MQTIKLQSIFFMVVLLLTTVLSVFLFWPFLIPLSLAGLVAVILNPVYKKILKLFRSETITSAVTVLLLVVVVVLPIIFLGGQILSEAQDLYITVSSGNVVSADFVTERVTRFAQKYAPGFTFDAREYLAGFSSWVVEKLGGLFSGTLDFTIKTLLGLIALFYFLRDGEYFKKQIFRLSPFTGDTEKVLIGSIQSAINSIVLGSLMVALIQGFLTGVGFAIFGVPNFVLWGSIAAVAALVPGFGTSIVWIPAVIYLYFYGVSGVWVGQLIWSVVLVGFIDNFLSPFIINKGVNVHPLLILFSILGGIEFFGPEGVLLGPLVLGILFALLRIAESAAGSGKSA